MDDVGGWRWRGLAKPPYSASFYQLSALPRHVRRETALRQDTAGLQPRHIPQLLGQSDAARGGNLSGLFWAPMPICRLPETWRRQGRRWQRRRKTKYVFSLVPTLSLLETELLLVVRGQLCAPHLSFALLLLKPIHTMGYDSPAFSRAALLESHAVYKISDTRRLR